jgi:predicted SpoU family rRNA methylase
MRDILERIERKFLVTGRKGRKAVLLDTRVLTTEPVVLTIWAVIPGSKEPEQDYRIELHGWKRQGSKVILTTGGVNIEDIEADVETEEHPLRPPKGKGWSWNMFGEWERVTSKGREVRRPEMD